MELKAEHKKVSQSRFIPLSSKQEAQQCWQNWTPSSSFERQNVGQFEENIDNEVPEKTARRSTQILGKQKNKIKISLRSSNPHKEEKHKKKIKNSTYFQDSSFHFPSSPNQNLTPSKNPKLYQSITLLLCCKEEDHQISNEHTKNCKIKTIHLSPPLANT